MSSYIVGYGKPPTNSKFRKGVSGNPRGRPKDRHEKLESIITELFGRKIEFTENGKRKVAATVEVIVTQIAAKAAKGDVSAARMLLKLLKHVENLRPGPFTIVMSEGMKDL
jgi:hypothetical protein